MYLLKDFYNEILQQSILKHNFILKSSLNCPDYF